MNALTSTGTQFNNKLKNNLLNNESVYASCPNVNVESGVNQEENQFSYNNQINQNMNNNNLNWNNSNNSLPTIAPRKPFIQRRERQLSSSFSGKFSSFYSNLSLASETMEDDLEQSTYSPTNSNYSSSAYRTFSAPTSPTPVNYTNQQPIFMNSNLNSNLNSNENNNFFNYERQPNPQMNFYQNFSTTTPATTDVSQATTTQSNSDQINDYYYSFYPQTASTTTNQMDQNISNENNNNSNMLTYFTCPSNANEFSSS